MNIGKISQLVSRAVKNGFSYTQSKLFKYTFAVVVFGLVSVSLLSFPITQADAATSIGVSNANVGSDGLIGYWTFDGKNMTNTTATDISGQGNNGTLVNMTKLNSTVLGKIGQGIQFNGSTKYIGIATGTLMNSATTGKLSVCTWVNPNNGSYATVIGKSNGSIQYQWGLYVTPGAETRFTTWQNDGGTNHSTAGGGIIPANHWSHICATTEEGVATKVYVNGVVVNATTTFLGTVSSSNSPVNFGRRPDGLYYYNGKMDDVRIYNRALTADEVKKIYQPGVATKINPYDIKTIYITSGTTFNAPADWPGIADSIEVIGGGASGEGTWDGGPNAKGGGGGAYAKKSNVVLSNGNTLKVGGAGQDTYVCNATSNCSSILGTSVVVGAKGASGMTGGLASSSIGDVTYSGGSGGAVDQSGAGGGGAAGPNGPGKDGGDAWHYWPGPYAGGAGGGGAGGGSSTNGGDAPQSTSVGGQGGTAQDGTAGGTEGVVGSRGSGGGGGHSGSNGAAGGRGVEWDSTHGAGGGGGGGGTGGSSFFAGTGGNGGLYGGGGGAAGQDAKSGSLSGGTGGQGLIVITYKRYNTASLTLSNTTNNKTGTNSGLIGYWNFDGKYMTNTTTIDATGDGNNGVLTNMTRNGSAVIGKIGQGLKFNVSNNSVISVPNNTTYNSYPLSYGVWFKTTLNSGSRAGFISKYVGGSANGWELGVVGRKLYSFYLNPSAGVGPAVDFLSPGDINDDKWHHAFITIDSTGGLMYLDGNLVASKSWTGTPTQATTNTQLLMGQSTGNSYFTGSLDEARVYNRILSATEVKALYKLGAK